MSNSPDITDVLLKVLKLLLTLLVEVLDDNPKP